MLRFKKIVHVFCAYMLKKEAFNAQRLCKTRTAVERRCPGTCPQQPSKEDVRERVRTEQSKLSTYGMKIKEAKLPVMVIFEGWGSSGKGSAIANVIKNIDPRFFQVATMDKPATPDELRKPFLYRYFIEIPEAGKFKFYDSFWMNEVTRDRIEGRLNDEDYEKRIRSINVTERQLTDNGYLVMKFFFHISRKEQKKRLQGAGV